MSRPEIWRRPSEACRSAAMPRLLSIAIALSVCFAARPAATCGGEPPLKANLDLPFDAFGSSEDEEEAPEVVFFYGGAYEADAVVFCLDESKSMNKNSRWELQLREITRAVGQLSPKTEFGMVFYGAGAYSFRSTLVRATKTNKQAAVAFLQARQMSLGTCMGPGIIKSLRMLLESSRKRRTVIIAGDGRPTVCPFVRGQGGMNPQQIEALLQETVAANPGGRVQVHTIFVGQPGETRAIDFMKRLAAMHRGTFRSVSR